MSTYIGKVIKTNQENIFSTNNPAKIIEVKDKKIESDSEFREVIKKGYLLSQINLSTVPKVIADAITKAMEDTKNATLSDALIQTLRQSLENLDDGIYKKTYIDNSITYLENILTSKVDAETAASIASSQIAVAVIGFASTAEVGIVRSRVENSETEIISVKETINTKDTARALQVSALSARVDDTFAAYSNAIELYVDGAGNAKSQKIETLSTNIGLQIQETNQLIVDSNNEWKAKSMKLITNPSGGITGYSFEDGSGLKSNFTINADNFKISNSAGTYTPFSIVGANLLFNGKVTFSNITGGESIVTTANVQNAINNNVTTIDGGKIVTNTLLGNTIKTNTLSANTLVAGTGSSTVWKGGGLVSSNFNGNAHGNIGSPTAGFRLSSDAAGTSANPNIYGAYIKGATIEGAALRLESTTAGNFSNYYHSSGAVKNFTVQSTVATTIYSDTLRLVSPSYGTGYIPNRIRNFTTTIISIITSGSSGSLGTAYVLLEIQISVDGGAYYKFDAMTTAYGVNKLYNGPLPVCINTIDIRLKIVHNRPTDYTHSISAFIDLKLDNTQG